MTKDIEREKMNYEKEREAFEKHASKFFNTNEVFEVKNDQYIYDEIIFMWDCWIESAKRAEKKLEGCVVVPVEMPDSFDDALYMYSNDISVVNSESDGFLPMADFDHGKVWQLVVEAARGGK